MMDLPHESEGTEWQHGSLEAESGDQSLPHSSPRLHPLFPSSASTPLTPAQRNPMASLGRFSPVATRPHGPGFTQPSMSEGNSPAPLGGSPFLHPLQTHRVRETHKALIDSDNITGRKLINQYEVIEEIGRGMHGKVKLARNLETGENVAIKIIPRFSKKRRLGKVTAKSPQDKTKKEIAILKKIRHDNVVALLEVIDDPELKKIYMVLEHVELGEIVWRKKGLPNVCSYERRRAEREMRGELPSAEEEHYDQLLERRQALKELKRQKMMQSFQNSHEYWSHEHGAAGDEGSSSYGQQSRIASRDDFAVSEASFSHSRSLPSSGAPSRTQSASSMSANAPLDFVDGQEWDEDIETPGPLKSHSNSATALAGTMYGPYQDEGVDLRGRSPSMADSIISHMSSVDLNSHAQDAFAEDFSFVPCFTFEQARSAFRDTVLGLEYLHYQGVVHRDIKPANLLWSKDHKVKISDFGVSYFGRPIRPGDLDDIVSESEAKDFDDDLELAKTVGTPAFFAPELCYTDIDMDQPRISEQIDVWSLGVTLYCLIFARIPFLAEDEFQMFRKIATEDVYIPQRRLKPVDPSTSPITSSLFKRHNAHPYRDDSDLEYEDVDALLYDLLRQMLCKNPEKRIRLRDIKRHAWVVQGITNPIGWLDDTDPARPSSGRRIQVDEREMSSAVVPLTLLERARSVVKKAVGKVMHPLVDRSESVSRRRATSSVASSAGDSMINHHPVTPQARLDRRRSLRPDDYFGSLTTSGAMADSTASVRSSNHPADHYDPLATLLATDGTSDAMKSHLRTASLKDMHRQQNMQQHADDTFLSLTPPLPADGSRTTPASPSHVGIMHAISDLATADARLSRSLLAGDEDGSRSQSVDRAIFHASDKRAQPQVGLNKAVAPAHIQAPRHPRPMRSVDLGRTSLAQSALAPLPMTYQPSQSGSDSGVSLNKTAPVPDRAHTVHRTEKHSLERTSSPVDDQGSAHHDFLSPRARELLQARQDSLSGGKYAQTGRSHEPSPPSSSDEPSQAPGVQTVSTSKSSSLESIEALGTPLTNPSELTSPVGATEPQNTSSGHTIVFQSDPSLPALLSGASSVSADADSEMLDKPGVVGKRAGLLETTDSLTPPALSKEPVDGFPLHGVFENEQAMESGQLSVQYTSSSGTPKTQETHSHNDRGHDEDHNENDDDSDDGVLMMAKKKKGSPGVSQSPSRFDPKRRDTNMSTASNETAKKISVRGEASEIS